MPLTARFNLADTVRLFELTTKRAEYGESTSALNWRAAERVTNCETSSQNTIGRGFTFHGSLTSGMRVSLERSGQIQTGRSTSPFPSKAYFLIHRSSSALNRVFEMRRSSLSTAGTDFFPGARRQGRRPTR